MSTEKNVDYKVLKSNIYKSCIAKGGGCDFRIDFEKLVALVSPMGLLPVKVGLEGNRVTPEIIPYISEYFEKTRLSWFDEEKHYTVLTFFRTDGLDEKAVAIIRKLNEPQVDDPEDDKTQDMSTLVAEYPCYFATIASYRNDDPKRCGRPSYVIVCRANKIVIKSSNYQYNPQDMS